MDSHVRPPNFRRNADTELFQGFNPSGSTDLRQAYGFARGLAKMHAQSPGGDAQRVPGHRLVWVRGGGFASTTLSAADDAFAIVGRHTQCGIALMEDPFVALRHLLVRSIKLPSGGVALRILDLQTNIGFVLPDGSRHTSIFAEGPIAVALGEYALVALPTETRDEDLPGELPAPEMHTPPAVREQLAALEKAMSPYRQNARPNRVSRITLMPRPVMIGEALPQSLGRLAGGGGWALTLQREGRSATVTLSNEDISRGALIGRSEKCCSELLRRITDVNTSRAHILILRDGPVIHAYDLASTQGTYLHGMPARRAVLYDQGTMLTLGRGDGAVRLLWQRTA